MTDDRDSRLQGPPDEGSNYARPWTDDIPVSGEEHTTLTALPHLGADTETLPAALAVRLCAQDPDGSWDIGMWFDDPTDRPDRGHAHHRRLRADDGQCTLHWDSEPHPEDLLGALTDPVLGLACATGHPTRDGWLVRYKNACLTAHSVAYKR
ncbi:hypothetical protein ACIRBZ_46970 [Streptomyces sp. NPDC094038]|uniref:hypothetical protein n=1 Tax=Streptomyces sp. NPDC094038 TaxID=3366055 RepID=UPI0037F66F89